MSEVVAVAPGRVNLMGDHTDHTGGRVLPLACDLATTVRGERGGDVVRLVTDLPGLPEAIVPLDAATGAGPGGWARMVAAVVAEVRPTEGLSGSVTSTVPAGAGLSSSAALCVALALALGFEGTAAELAAVAQRSEQAATGVPCGIMDQLASASGVEGHALRIDCTDLTVRPVPVPEDLDVLVVHCGVDRALEATPYAELVAQLRAAEAVIGPLRLAGPAEVDRLADPDQRRRARHVVTENARVDELVAALGAGDRRGIGAVLAASHASLRDDLRVSVPALDELVDELGRTSGVLGARLTGAGFGGCAVALSEAGARLPAGRRAWRVRPTGGASTSAGR